MAPAPLHSTVHKVTWMKRKENNRPSLSTVMFSMMSQRRWIVSVTCFSQTPWQFHMTHSNYIRGIVPYLWKHNITHHTARLVDSTSQLLSNSQTKVVQPGQKIISKYKPMIKSPICFKYRQTAGHSMYCSTLSACFWYVRPAALNKLPHELSTLPILTSFKRHECCTYYF